MRAIRVHEFGEPDVLKLETVPDPTPGPGQVVVRAKAIGVNPVETYVRAGKYGPRQFPYVPGSDIGGVIESVGPGVTQWKAGDRVYTASTLSGAYAELALCDAGKVFRLPDGVSFAAGAALGVPAATAYKAVFMRGQAKPGETVLVHGASGAVGLFCVQMLRAHGCTVVGTGGTAEGRELVKREGAHHALDHTAAGYLDELAKLTGGAGVELIVEMLANVNLDKDLGALAKFGRVVVVGNRGRIEIDPRQTMARDADVRGMTLMNVTDAELKSIHAALGAMLEAKTIRPIIDTEMPLADAARAHREVLEGGSRGKIVMVP
ncbi:MAG TPA: NADPH:quinone reductase [Tepidisphaeraceae bacterium]|nr:NADPH:quinone reductase [Tepidisphaeraceae bacterium]